MLHPTKKENGEIDDVSCCDALLHFVGIGWKVLFALVPPPHYIGGWACFLVSLIFIGLVTALLGEAATLFGCVLGIKRGVTAITFIALGTSIPDCFASRTAANNSRYADEAIGNITGSNSVNVFIGLGLPWIIAAAYHSNKEVAPGASPSQFKINANGLIVAVILYIGLSVLTFFTLMCRRAVAKGELGGSTGGRYGSAAWFFLLWIIFIVLATCGFYGVIKDP